MFVPCSDEEEISFAGFTFVLPAISVGNVGQLAIDLLIHNLCLKRVGYFYDDCILPLVGNNPFDEPDCNDGSLVTSSEVFMCDQSKIVVLQLRAPLAKGCRQIFCDNIAKWVKKSEMKQTVLLTSSIASERSDSQIQNGPFRYLLSPKGKHLEKTFLDQYGWRCLEERHASSVVLVVKNEKQKESERNRDVFLSGGGYTKSFYHTCCRESLPLATFLVFCAEGDNIPEATILLYHLNIWMEFKRKKNSNNCESNNLAKTLEVEWHEPPSWKNLYGTPRYSTIF
ncbi:proteasome assembly chaperone 2-like isoform X2 [Xenia sp. Carnegie-2017]|uniref:proteasome assembly chaperone 2-like isoform X2 n=1 Tax=Xenia sp. Carnegie-2017 TaxID=2897299 RepID=UPI001F04C6AA|nr:proteasome assembly chaperone 2-like isoform X2 [Xenia sp. Carnegie-2017]XP_046842745.1 proteasome assembly chaperone 2-like isoform X2 [Xenia sp. Carnegie-2017]